MFEECIAQLVSCTFRGLLMGSAPFTFRSCILKKKKEKKVFSVGLSKGQHKGDLNPTQNWAKVALGLTALLGAPSEVPSRSTGLAFQFAVAALIRPHPVLSPCPPCFCVSLSYRVLYKHDLQDQSLRAGLQKAQCQSALQPFY